MYFLPAERFMRRDPRDVDWHESRSLRFPDKKQNMGDDLKHNSCGTAFVQTCFEADGPDKLQVADFANVQTAMAVACAEILRRRRRSKRRNATPHAPRAPDEVQRRFRPALQGLIVVDAANRTVVARACGRGQRPEAAEADNRGYRSVGGGLPKELSADAGGARPPLNRSSDRSSNRAASDDSICAACGVCGWNVGWSGPPTIRASRSPRGRLRGTSWLDLPRILPNRPETR